MSVFDVAEQKLGAAAVFVTGQVEVVLQSRLRREMDEHGPPVLHLEGLGKLPDGGRLADAAGLGAAVRSCEMLVAEGFNVNVVVLDKGEDPDANGEQGIQPSPAEKGHPNAAGDHGSGRIDFVAGSATDCRLVGKVTNNVLLPTRYR